MEIKAKFLGQKGQIFNLGTKSFLPNIWTVITLQEAIQLYQESFELFDFGDSLDFIKGETGRNFSKSEISEIKTKKSKKKKEDK